MREYASLTPGGVKKRLRKVAWIALERYRIDVKRLDYLIEETNVFLKSSIWKTICMPSRFFKSSQLLYN